MSAVHIVFGSQLFEPKHLPLNKKDSLIFMLEHEELCTYYRFHKIKIAFFLSAMRHYAEELKAEGYRVHYIPLTESAKGKSYEEQLLAFLKKEKVSKLTVFEIEDKFMESRVNDLCQKHDLELQVFPNPQFLTTREEFFAYLKKSKKPFMKTFYEGQRKRTKILMDSQGKPVGGQFSYDTENRLKLPSDLKPPEPLKTKRDSIDEEVLKLVSKRFADHPGSLDHFWVPTTRKDSQKWASQFFKQRFSLFGEYEDAITPRSDFVYHSAISPMMNVGLITPDQIVKEALYHHKEHKVPLNSVEGFLRQVIGWREFVRGIYQNFSEKQENLNFFKNKRGLTQDWYNGTTGIPPLDDAIQKVDRLAYNHHIERLMVISNMMNLSEIHPLECHRWFMEMYVDSSDWVMGPNVFGMSLFSDGGIFATKPYTCGSNYYLKMSNDYKKGDWCDIVDGLYWRFIDKHRDFYGKNPRLNMMVRTLDKMNSDRKELIFKSAESFLKEKTKPNL
jgi:deoxyribodipyrimidine photolyase-related protein